MPQNETTGLETSNSAPRAMGSFGFAAMFRSGAYSPEDTEMVAVKFETLGAEIERLRFRLARIEHAPVPEGNEIAMTLRRWAEPRDGEPTNGDSTAALGVLLRKFYTDAEAFQWLTAPQPLFDGAIALDMIADGRIGDLVLSLRRMDEGVYL